MNLLETARDNMIPSIKGRYITNEHILPFLESLPASFGLQILGTSVENRNIYGLRIGSGKTKIYIWSQMHGNESTTTKGLLDFISFLNAGNETAQKILNAFDLFIIPILNPDGAKAYTRVNANEVDLNRDSIALSQPESVLLRQCFDDFQPDFAFNLHDQRTIFAAGNTNHPATISFLAPSYNETRDINPVRLQAMQIISAINAAVFPYIPKQIGRFDDSFNLNCIGDRFTNLGVPTILFEAGHFQNDYEREETRKIVFVSLLASLLCILEKSYLHFTSADYFLIPENNKLIHDILLRNVRYKNGEHNKDVNLGILYKEALISDEITFLPVFDVDLIKNHQFGHLECNATDFEINSTEDLSIILNKMNLKRGDNGVFSVNDLLKY